MRVFIRDQAARLENLLPEFRRRSLSFGEPSGLPTTAFQERVGPRFEDLRELNLDFLFRYEIFPPRILKFFGEWQSEGRSMREGDVIVQQAIVPPCCCGLKLVFAVRVLSITHERNKVAFSYGTLDGHPETGVNEFSFVVRTNEIFAVVQTFARPAHILARLLAPLFTNPYVRYCNRRAARQMKSQFDSANAQLVGLRHGAGKEW